MHHPPLAVAVAALGSALALCACQSPGGGAARPLGANAIACRSPGTLQALHAGGDRFQRIADDELASGNCRVFVANHPVKSRTIDQGLLRFVDPADGRTYWAQAPG